MAATVIGSGITIEGEVSSSEEVVVAGTIRGKLEVSGQVTIESDGVVEADIEALHVCIDEGDAIAIKDALETLELSAYKIAEAMYGNVDLEAAAEGEAQPES